MSQMRQPKPDWGRRGTVPKGKAGPMPPPNGRTVATRPYATILNVSMHEGVESDVLVDNVVTTVEKARDAQYWREHEPPAFITFRLHGMEDVSSEVRPATRGERLRLWLQRALAWTRP